MQLLVELPGNLPDAAHCTPQQFIKEAKLKTLRNEAVILRYGRNAHRNQ